MVNPGLCAVSVYVTFGDWEAIDFMQKTQTRQAQGNKNAYQVIDLQGSSLAEEPFEHPWFTTSSAALKVNSQRLRSCCVQMEVR